MFYDLKDKKLKNSGENWIAPNAVVIGEHDILNKEGLRFKDEFVRHKILDLIGDIFLSGYAVEGYFHGKKSGHSLNKKILKKLFSDKENFKLI